MQTFAFILKKILGTLLMPLPLLFTALLVLRLRMRASKGAKRFLTAALLFLFAVSYDPLADMLLGRLESRYPALQHASPDIRYIYVLGNDHQSDPTLPITSQLSPEAIVRLNEGIRLYRKLQGKAKLILSGYHGLHGDPSSHAAMQRRLALALDIPRDALIVLETPKDTREEALAAKAVAGNAKVAVVTSAYHMPRAFALFRQAGVDAVAAPTYHLASTSRPAYAAVLSSRALYKSTLYMHEILGMAWERLKGYIEEAFT